MTECEAGAEETTIVAALLHDIGHYLPHASAVELLQNGQSFGRKSHDVIGETYLRQLGFPREVTALVGAHVDAKRYLTATDRGYMERLSAVSKTSLKFQVSGTKRDGSISADVDREDRSARERWGSSRRIRC